MLFDQAATEDEEAEAAAEVSAEDVAQESAPEAEIQEEAVQEAAASDIEVSDDVARQLEDLSDTIHKSQNPQPEPEAAEDPDKLLDKIQEEQIQQEAELETPVEQAAEPECEPVAEVEESHEDVLPHAEDVLDSLDREMSNLNDLVAEETSESHDDSDDIVMQELEDKVSPPPAASQEDKVKAQANDPQPARPRERVGMNSAQRVVISGLEASNKPFEKVVPGPAKDIMGIVAVITLAVSMATLGLFLIFGGS